MNSVARGRKPVHSIPAGPAPEPAEPFIPPPGDDAWWASVVAACEAEREYTAEPEPEPAPGEIPGWVETQASYYRSLDTVAGRWLADELDQLATVWRDLNATSVEVFKRSRAAAVHADRLEHWADGNAAGFREAHKQQERFSWY